MDVATDVQSAGARVRGLRLADAADTGPRVNAAQAAAVARERAARGSAALVGSDTRLEARRAAREQARGVRPKREAEAASGSLWSRLVSAVRTIVGAVAGMVLAHQRAALAIAILMGVAGMLYGPTRDWYTAMRRGQDLQTRYDALSAENESLEHDLNRLQTREGVEDEARKRGYVLEGETGVVVENLPDELSGDAGSGDDVSADGRDATTKALDLLFGYAPA